MNREIFRSKQWPLAALTSRGMHSDVPFASPGASPLRDIIEFRKTHKGSLHGLQGKLGACL